VRVYNNMFHHILPERISSKFYENVISHSSFLSQSRIQLKSTSEPQTEFFFIIFLTLEHIQSRYNVNNLIPILFTVKPIGKMVDVHLFDGRSVNGNLLESLFFSSK